jgi:hypothetical protein
MQRRDKNSSRRRDGLRSGVLVWFLGVRGVGCGLFVGRNGRSRAVCSILMVESVVR